MSSSSLADVINSSSDVNQVRKYDWKLKKSVIDAIIAHGGSIFGGAVRDTYRHDTHADWYYELHTRQRICYEYAMYEDVSYLPETLGRLDIPVDIDACISSKSLDALLVGLSKMNLTVTKKFERDPSGYLRACTIVNGQVLHYKYTITPHKGDAFRKKIRTECFPAILRSMPACNELIDIFIEKFMQSIDTLQLISFDIDLMVIQELPTPENPIIEAPFGNLDFECNGLIMDKHGIRLSQHIMPDIKNPIQRHGILTRILDDVLHKKALMCKRVTRERVKKMYSKGWNIQSINILMVNTAYISESSEDVSDDGSVSTGGHCIICHEDCNDPHYKLQCCDARYHGKCLKDCWLTGSHSISNTEKCPMCRGYVSNTDSDNKLLKVLCDA